MKHADLLTVTPLELMKLWGELVECYHGKHGFGGDTAEIYAYRLHSHAANCNVSRIKEEGMRESAAALCALCRLFAEEFDCSVRIEGLTPLNWRDSIGAGFDHRALVKVIRKN